MNANDENDLGKINLLEYIKTLKEHYLEMQKEISRLEKERNLCCDTYLKLRGAVELTLDWHYDNVQNNKETGFKMFPTLQHDVFIEASTAIKEVDAILKAEKYKQGDSE